MHPCTFRAKSMWHSDLPAPLLLASQAQLPPICCIQRELAAVNQNCEPPSSSFQTRTGTCSRATMQAPMHAGLPASHAGPAQGAAGARVDSGGTQAGNAQAHGASNTHQQGRKAPRRRVLTSLSLQVFLYFGGWWDVFYYLLNILVFIYKGVNLPYPERNFAMEFCFAWLWCFIEIPRLFLASKGNKTEGAGPLIFSFILAAPLIAMYVYFVKFQTYVLKIDEILNAIALAFISLQVVLGLLACFRFVVATRFA